MISLYKKIIFYFLLNFSYILSKKLLRKTYLYNSDDKSERNLTVRLIVLGIVIIIIVVLIILFFHYRKKCKKKNRYLSRNSIANIIVYSTQRNNNNQNNIDKEELKKYYILENLIEPFYYIDDLLINEKHNNNKCVICLLYFKKFKSKICKTPCNHYYHYFCFQKFILEGNNNKCPLCKFDLFNCLKTIEIDYDKIHKIEPNEEDNPFNESDDTKEIEKYFEKDKLQLKSNIFHENKNNQTNEN